MEKRADVMEAYLQYRAFTPSFKPTHAPIVEGKEEEALKTLASSPLIYVTFDENDARNPQNWSKTYKTFVIGLLAFLTLSLTFASSVSSAAEQGMMEEFGCSQIAATAATSMFLIGMGVGAMPMAPLSECKCALFIKRSSRTSCIAEWWRTLSTLNGCMLLFKIDATEGCFSWRQDYTGGKCTSYMLHITLSFSLRP